MKKLSSEEVISRFVEIHGNKYDYSKFNFINTHYKSIIICKEHGEFLQTPSKHFYQGCRKCSTLNSKYTTDEILDNLGLVHGDKYQFEIGENYVDIRSFIYLICKHGKHSIRASSALNGQGCVYCSGKKWNNNDLIEKLSVIHNNKYSYVEIGRKNIKAECKLHGIFEIKKDKHLLGYGCRKCSDRKKYDTEFFISVIRNKFNNYSFSKCVYKKFTDKVIITCNNHGDFEQYPQYLLDGHGCKKCSLKYTNEEFLDICRTKHPEIDHSEVLYNGVQKKIKLKCKVHGYFNQMAGYYINNSKGCPNCNETKGEKLIRLYLSDNSENFIQQYKYDRFYFDFYLPDRNLFIEFNGKQHYSPIDFFGGDNAYEKQKKKDIEKNNLFEENKDIKLLIIPYWKIKKINEILLKELYENKESIKD
jgi:hypothetical protein